MVLIPVPLVPDHLNTVLMVLIQVLMQVLLVSGHQITVLMEQNLVHLELDPLSTVHMALTPVQIPVHLAPVLQNTAPMELIQVHSVPDLVNTARMVLIQALLEPGQANTALTVLTRVLLELDHPSTVHTVLTPAQIPIPLVPVLQNTAPTELIPAHSVPDLVNTARMVPTQVRLEPDLLNTALMVLVHMSTQVTELPLHLEMHKPYPKTGHYLNPNGQVLLILTLSNKSLDRLLLILLEPLLTVVVSPQLLL